MRLIYAVLILLLLALMASACGQQNAEDWNNKGYALLNQSNYDEAIQAFDNAIEIDPQNAYAWYGKGVALGNKEAQSIKGVRIDDGFFYTRIENNEALQAFDKAIELNPKNVDSWIRKGLILYLQDKNNEALQAFDKAIELDPRNAEAWGKKALVLIYLGKHEEASEASNMANELRRPGLRALRAD